MTNNEITETNASSVLNERGEVLADSTHLLDDTFKTVTEKPDSHLIIPLTNDFFHTDYGLDERITIENVEYNGAKDEKHVRHYSDLVYRIRNRRYLIECLAYSDDTIVFRMCEYAFLESFGHAKEISPWEVRYRLPRMGLLLIRPIADAPDQATIHIEGDDFSAVTHMEIIKMSSYTVDELIARKLYILMPFTYFIYPEKDRRTEAERKQMTSDLNRMFQAIDEAVKSGELSSMEANTIVASIMEVWGVYTEKDSETHKEVEETMSGRIHVPYEEEMKQIFEEGKAQGKAEGKAEGYSMLQNLVDKGTITPEQAADAAGISVSAFNNKVASLK